MPPVTGPGAMLHALPDAEAEIGRRRSRKPGPGRARLAPAIDENVRSLRRFLAKPSPSCCAGAHQAERRNAACCHSRRGKHVVTCARFPAAHASTADSAQRVEGNSPPRCGRRSEPGRGPAKDSARSFAVHSEPVSPGVGGVRKPWVFEFGFFSTLDWLQVLGAALSPPPEFGTVCETVGSTPAWRCGHRSRLHMVAAPFAGQRSSLEGCVRKTGMA
jgi:hypothetical protein